MTPRVGQVHKMGVRFGNQVRVKCPHCKIFLAVAQKTVCARCGTEYLDRGEDRYEVVGTRG